MARVTKVLKLSMVNQFMVTSKVSTTEKLDGIYACDWVLGKSLRDGVQVVLSKCIWRTDQDWSKRRAIYQSFNAFSWEYQANFGGRIVSAKRRAEALPAAQRDIPREHAMVKFKDEGVMAKALNEGGSDPEKEEARFPEPERSGETIPGEAMKQDGAHEPECKHICQSTVYGKRHSRLDYLFTLRYAVGHHALGTPPPRQRVPGTSPPSSVFVMKGLRFAFNSSAGVKVVADPHHERNSGIVPKSRK